MNEWSNDNEKAAARMATAISKREYYNTNPIYDLIIIGADSVELATGVYAGRAKLKTLILEKSNPGGQVGNTAEVVNYPGIHKTSGPELVEEMKNHVRDLDAKIEAAKIEQVELSGEIKKLYSTSGTYRSRAVIIAAGASLRHGRFKGEELYSGHGVTYRATCDGELSSRLDIFVIGGGYAVAGEAIYLARFTKSVTTVIRGKDFSYARTVVEKAIAHPKTTAKYNTLLGKVEGDSLPRQTYLQDRLTGEASVYDARGNGTLGVFAFVGCDPTTELFREQVGIDEDGYILTDDVMHTNVPGVFVVGDLRPKLLHQIVTTMADGAVAATSTKEYITSEKERLGLPMFEEDAATVEPGPEQKEDKAENPAFVSDGTRLGGELKKQLAQVFQHLEKEMTVVTVVDPSNQKSLELEGFLREIESLSDLIHLHVLQKGEDPELEQSLGIGCYPLTVFLGENGHFSGVKFSGVPDGREINSSVLDILHLAAGDKLTEKQLKKIHQLPPDTTLKIRVTLTCPCCPSIIAAAHSIAIVSGGNVATGMMGVALFPDIRKKYHIMSVPAFIVDNNEQTTFGAQSFDRVLQKAMED